MSTVEQPSPDDPDSPLPELTFGRRPNTAPSVSLPERWTAQAVDELEDLIACCQLKAEACRWAARRRRLLAERASFQREIAPRDRALVDKAKQLGDCFLWMCSADSPDPSDERLYDVVAQAFDAVAAGLLLMQDGRSAGRTTDLKQTLMLLAEAQLVLREAIQKLGGPSDSDQVRAFHLLKQTAEAGHLHLTHHMRLTDSADPTAGADLLTRICEVRRRRCESFEKTRQSPLLFDRLRKLLSGCGGDSAASAPAAELWREAISLIEQLVDAGLPPSDRQLRELILPVMDLLPESVAVPPSMELVLRELDRYLAGLPASAMVETPQPTAEVKRVAELLHGRAIVLIGGDRRAHAEQALKIAFRLQDLVWIATRPHESTKGFEPPIAQPNVAVVLLTIRWASHSFGEIKSHCDHVGKPLVRLPAGYNPQQVAIQILEQASGLLGGGVPGDIE